MFAAWGMECRLSFHKCSVHGAKIEGKLATLYSAWFNADGGRTAWKQRICAPCVKETLAPLMRAATDASPDLTMCPACGTDSSSDLDPIYLTLYLPKQESREFALTTCASCAVTCRVSLQRGAEKLPDRQNVSNGTSKSAGDEWNDL